MSVSRRPAVLLLLLNWSCTPTATRTGLDAVSGAGLISGGVEVLLSTASRLKVRLHLGPLLVETRSTPAGAFGRIVLHEAAVALRHGSELVSQPEIPMQTLYVALPLGRSAAVSVAAEGSPTLLTSRLYPVQPPRRSAAGPQPGDPRPVDPGGFVFDPALYAAGASSVLQPLLFAPVAAPGTNIHRLTLALVDVAATGETLRYASLLIDIQFEDGSPTCFKRQRVPVGATLDEIDQRLDQLVSSTEASVVNGLLLEQLTCVEELVPTDPGARLIVVTPPVFRAVAEQLAQHKTARGITSRVVETTAISPSGPLTDLALRDYVRAAHDGWAVQPKWLLLLGDVEQIPTHYEAPNIWDSARNAGDAFYGLTDAADAATSEARLAVGRFPVDTAAQAQMMVDRVVAIETSPPPSDSGYYLKAALAAQFQDDDLDHREDRRYTETAENIRTHLALRGRQVQRIYTAPAASNPSWWQGGAAVPANLRRPLFGWSGSTAAILGAFNGGVSVFLHRDHGWWWGWSAPMFSTGDVPGAAAPGTQFPVVFSVNCASGLFDNETVDLPANRVGAGYGPDPAAAYFAEQLLRKPGGALAIVGDSRSSDTVLNDELARGLFDAVYPDYLPFGPAAPVRRLGDLLNHAKSYLRERGFGAGSLAQHLTIYNLLGDPTVELATEAPLPLGIGSLASSGDLLLVPVLSLPPCPGCPAPALPLDTILATAMDGGGQLVARGVPGPDAVVRLQVGGFHGQLQVRISGSGVRPALRQATLPLQQGP